MLIALFFACAPETPLDVGLPADGDARLEEGSYATRPSGQSITTTASGVFQVDNVPVVAPGEESSSAPARYSLRWEGEQLSGTLDVVAVRDGAHLVIGGERLVSRPVEERDVSLSVVVPASDVAPGGTMPGRLYYGETPADGRWPDTLLFDDPVVTVLGGTAEVGGTVSLRIEEATLQADPRIGAAFAGEMFEGSFLMSFDAYAQRDCPSLTPAALAFVSQTPDALGAVGYLGILRENQGDDPEFPFLITGPALNPLLGVNSTRPLRRVSDSGGLLELTLRNTTLFDMDTRVGPDGWFEVARRIEVDGREWPGAFPIALERFYATSADASLEDASCVVRFAGSLVPY